MAQKRIQYQDDFLSKANINSNINILWGKVLPILLHRKYLYERFTRENDKSDVIVALEQYISIIAAGYFGGKEPQYKVQKANETQKGILKKIFNKVFGEKNNSEEFQAIIDYITKYNDNGSFFYDVVLDFITTGACYGLMYQRKKDNEIVYAHTSSLNSVAIWNYETPSQKIGLLRAWFENTANGGIETHLEIITKDYKKQFVDGTEKTSITDSTKYEFEEVKDSTKEVYWNDLPVFAVENPTGLCFFENVIPLVKKHEQVIRNNANTFQYNDDAKLKITGFTPENDALIQVTDEKGQPKVDDNGNQVMMKNPARTQEDNAILSAKVFYTPDKDGDIDWVIKNINDTASENHKKTCLDMALMTSGVPNVTDQGFTDADNAAALEKKFFPLEQFLQQPHHLFKKELLRMWEMITNRINLKRGTKFDFRDIEVILNRNLPQNNQEIIDTWLKLRGLLSDKTVIEHLPYDLDAESELAEMDAQNETNIEKNIQNMAKMGQDVSSVALNTKQDNPNKKFEQENEVKKENIKQSDTVEKMNKEEKKVL